MYVLLYNLKVDLLMLCVQCLVYDLFDLLELLEIDGMLLLCYVFIYGGLCVFIYYMLKEEFIKLFYDYFDLYCSNLNLDVQMVLVLVMFGCVLGCEKGEVNLLLCMFNGVQKFFVVLWFGCDSFVCFLLLVLLCCMVDEYGMDKIIVQKLVCVVCMYFVC